MHLVVLNWIGLVVSTGLGIFAGVRLLKYLGRHELPDQAEGHASGFLTDALAYVSGVLGIMLGLLLFFSVQVFEDASASAKDEALALVDVYEAADYFPAAPADPLRRDTICLMRSVATDSWVAAEAGDLTGDENTAAWAAAVRQGIQALPSDGNVQAEAQKAAMDSFQTAQNARQSRILSSVWKLPTIVWLVLDLGAFVFAGLVVLSLPGRRRTAFVLIGACLLFTMGVVGALSMFATPFTRLGVSVQPTAVEGALVRLQGTYPEQDWSACPRLAESVPNPS
ncbi:MAG: DUF4239 domain-containing protein [Actinobacteria bacterium]|nr:MAG: DUF4239 domain-containing protein [Actinomycetota bacterium]